MASLVCAVVRTPDGTSEPSRIVAGCPGPVPDGRLDSVGSPSRQWRRIAEMPTGMEGTEAIEPASRDELAALQLSRLRWSLQHAYQNVPHYRAAFDAAGAHPDDLR